MTATSPSLSNSRGEGSSDFWRQIIHLQGDCRGLLKGLNGSVSFTTG